MDLIVKTVFGSHLYGTETESSDHDFKGIYLPSKGDCFLNRVDSNISETTGKANSKNTKEDVDIEIFSLQEFMRLANNGEMIVIDLLHTPLDKILETSQIWELLYKNRSKFYTKNLAGYLGYIRKQTAKYGIKGSRLQAMEEVMDVLHSVPTLDFIGEHATTVKDIWSKLPLNEYCRFIDNPKEKRWQHYEVCGKQLQETMRVDYARSIVKNMYDSYGARAQMAKNNEGIDWKAVSHAFRAGLQLEEIYTTGDLKYPLKDANYIRNIKTGKFHYANDGIGEELEGILLHIEDLARTCSYPDKMDKEWMDNFILGCYE